MTLKLLFTGSLLDAQHQRESVENKPASGEQASKFTCCAVGKDIFGISPSWCDKQMAATPKQVPYCALIDFS